MSSAEYGASRHEMMGYSEIEADPEFGPILQEQALEYLRNEDKEFFDANFSGELDEEGYLLNKDGSKSNTKPSQNIQAGMETVLQRTRQEISRRGQ